MIAARKKFSENAIVSKMTKSVTKTQFWPESCDPVGNFRPKNAKKMFLLKKPKNHQKSCQKRQRVHLMTHRWAKRGTTQPEMAPFCDFEDSQMAKKVRKYFFSKSSEMSLESVRNVQNMFFDDVRKIFAL